MFSADPKRADPVKDAKHALGMTVEDRLKLVVALDSSDDDDNDGDDDDDDDDDGSADGNEDEESMDVDGSVAGKL